MVLAPSRWADMVVALPANLRAGAAHLPVDPEYPAERIAFMLRDSAPAPLLTTTQVLPTAYVICTSGTGSGGRLYRLCTS